MLHFLSFMKKKKVLIVTDDGRDVDDIEAIVYLLGRKDVEIVGFIATHMIPDKRARILRLMMLHFGKKNMPIGVGSVFPIGKEDVILEKYLKEHNIDGISYEGDGLLENFPNGEQLILHMIQKYKKDLQIAVFAPSTDLAKAANSNPKLFSQIGGFFIQGQALVKNGKLFPDYQAYNLNEDNIATETIFSFQDRIPFTFVGKHAAYQTPLMKSDFERFTNTGHPVGRYLTTHAKKGIECFVKRAPQIFEKVFHHPASDYQNLKELSKPYDALAAMAMVDQSGMNPVRVGIHTLIGMSENNNGITDPVLVKKNMMDGILRGLKKRSILSRLGFYTQKSTI